MLNFRSAGDEVAENWDTNFIWKMMHRRSGSLPPADPLIKQGGVGNEWETSQPSGRLNRSCSPSHRSCNVFMMAPSIGTVTLL